MIDTQRIKNILYQNKINLADLEEQLSTEYGLSEFILKELDKHDGLTQVQLSTLTKKNQSNISRALSKLVKYDKVSTKREQHGIHTVTVYRKKIKDANVK